MHRRIRNTGGTEDGWSEDGDTSYANPFLHNLKPDDELDTATCVELARADAEEHREVRRVAGGLALKFGDVANILELSLGLASVCTCLASKAAEDVASFFFAANLYEPTRRLREEPTYGKKKQQWGNLEPDWEPPGECGNSSLVEIAAAKIKLSARDSRIDRIVEYSLFDPVCDNDTEDVQGELNSYELTTGGMLGSLGSPDGNDGVEHSSPPSVDETGEDHPGVVLSRSLKTGTNDGPTSSKSNRLDTSISITEGTTDKTAHESAEIINGDNAALKKGVINDWSAGYRISVAELHGVVIVVWRRVDTSHHTLIITEEEDGQGGDTVDGNEKASLLQFVDHIGSWNEIHCGFYRQR